MKEVRTNEKNLLSCEFNLDTACVEMKFVDGSMISIHCTAGEDEAAHTMYQQSELLYFNGVDSVSISKRLGHAQVSTTANIYAHIMEEADKKNADILADVFLKKA